MKLRATELFRTCGVVIFSIGLTTAIALPFIRYTLNTRDYQTSLELIQLKTNIPCIGAIRLRGLRLSWSIGQGTWGIERAEQLISNDEASEAVSFIATSNRCVPI